MRYLAAAATLVTLCVSAVAVGAQSYRPDYDTPNGVEIVAVYLSAMDCGPCHDPRLPTLLDSIKVQLKRQAIARGQRFRTVFVGMDWDPARSLLMATTDGRWNELDLGRDWFNAGAELYAWGDTTKTPALGTMVVYEQRITMSDRVRFGPRRMLKRVMGADELAKWAALGSPIPDSSLRQHRGAWH